MTPPQIPIKYQLPVVNGYPGKYISLQSLKIVHSAGVGYLQNTGNPVFLLMLWVICLCVFELMRTMAPPWAYKIALGELSCSTLTMYDLLLDWRILSIGPIDLSTIHSAEISLVPVSNWSSSFRMPGKPLCCTAKVTSWMLHENGDGMVGILVKNRTICSSPSSPWDVRACRREESKVVRISQDGFLGSWK